MIYDFQRQLREAASCSDEKFAAFLLGLDPLFTKMSGRQQRELVSGALDCGAGVAKTLLDDFGGKRPSEIAEQLGLRISEINMSNTKLVLSTYDHDAKLISLNAAMLDVIVRKKEKYGLSVLLGPFSPTEIAVAHELFHHVEESDDSLFTKKFRIILWNFGPLVHKSTVKSAEEIAAMACAKELSRLSFNPLLLDAIFLQGMAPGQAQQWFYRLAR